MYRAGFALLALLLISTLAVAAAADAKQASSGGEPPEIEIETVIKQTVNLVHADGSALTGGLYGGQQEECGVGTQAYVEALTAAGDRDWLRCHDSSPAGLCAQLGGQSLFAGFTSIDPTTIAASSVRDVAVDAATGRVAIAGELITACQNGPDLDVGRGAFVAVLDQDGNLLTDTFYGTPTDCTPPTDGCCLELCDGGESGGSGGSGQQCGARGLAMRGNQIVVTGWCQTPGVASGNEFFVASLTSDLTENWRFQAGGPESDRGLAIAIGDLGEVYATGYTVFGAKHREIFVSKHDTADGSLTTFLMGGGSLDDEGESLTVNAQGDLLLAGYVNDQATLGGLTIGSPGDGYIAFAAVLDGGDLTPLSILPAPPPAALTWGVGPEVDRARVRGPLDLGMSAPPPPPTPLIGDPFVGVDCMATIGGATGGCNQVLGGNGALNLTPGFDPEAPELLVIEVELLLNPAQAAFRLSSLNVTIESEYCYTVTLWLNGLRNNQDVEVGQQQVCPLDEPRLTIPISAELTEDLGFDGLFSPLPSDRLELIMRFEFAPSVCNCPASVISCECTEPTKEASVEEVELEPDS